MLPSSLFTRLQVFILDSLALYAPRDQRELQSVCERVAPRLQHVNAAVVLSAIKVLMRLVDRLEDAEYRDSLLRKLAPPLGAPCSAVGRAEEDTLVVPQCSCSCLLFINR
jgi:vesicle coat complex subunit